MNGILFKSTLRSIGRNFGRFVAIMLIVATGFAFFAGITASGPDMLATAKQYYDDYNLMDIRVQSNLGLTAADAQEISAVEGVDYVMPEKFVDALVWVNGDVESDIDGSQISTRAYGISLDMLGTYALGVKDPAFINRPELLEGRFPAAENECLVDASRLSTPESYQIGNVITLGGDGASIEVSLSVTDFTIVGIIRSPYYVSFERGNSLVGSGKIGTYIYIPDSVIKNDYYSEIYVTVAGAQAYEPYSDAYFDYVKQTADRIGEIAPGRLAVRAAQLNAELPPKVADAQVQLNTLTAEADRQFAEKEAQLKQLENYAANGDALYAQAVQEYEAQFSESTTRLSDSQNDYNQKANTYNQLQSYVLAAENAYSASLAEYQAKQAEYNQKYSDYTAARTVYENATGQVANLRSLIDRTKNVFDQLQQLQGTAVDNADIQNIIGVFAAINPELYQAINSLSSRTLAFDALALIQPQLEEYESQLAAQEQTLSEAKVTLDAAEAQLASSDAQLQSSSTQLANYRATLDGYNAQLAQAKSELDAYGNIIKDSGYQLSLAQLQAQQRLAEVQALLQNADARLEEAKKELADAKKDVNEKMLLARTVIDAGQKTLSSISSAKWNVFDRSDTPGYSGYGSAASNIQTLAYIFPIFFVLVAAMVCLTTMSRMVQDERTQIGTLKAMGFTDGQISAGYVLYALIASVVGSVLGVSVGIYALPQAVFAAYGIMYDLPPVLIEMPGTAVAVGFVIFCLMSVFVALWALRRELYVVPSVLMRAKAPKSGRRILLEKVTFIWRRLSFTSKVTVRNTFRAPKRAIMTVISIIGCSALLLAGLGMNDSVSAIMTKQFGEGGIANYDMQIVFDEPQTPGASSVADSISREPGVDGVLLTAMTSLSGSSERIDRDYDVYVLVPADPMALGSMVNLIDAADGTVRGIDDTGAVITEKFAGESKTGVGDSVTLTDADGKTVSVIVSGIVENYIFDYVYMTPTVYTAVFGEEASYHYALAKLSADVLAASNATTSPDAVNPKAAIAANIGDRLGVTAVAYTSDTVDTFNEVVKAISFVVVLFIIAAALLEMIVLYNLANVNIHERLREIATLKVLGFYDKEVSSYIYRENVVLTVIGAIIGIPAGILLHKLMLRVIVVDSVMYGKTIAPLSYVLAFAATVIFSLLVDLLLHRKLRNVSMVESFKSLD